MEPRATHPAALDEEALLRECRLSRGRSGGPGGQHRNKVETMVELTHEPTGVSAHAGERRSPEVNKRVAIRRLRLALATQVRVGVPDGECRSELWLSRCRDGRVSVNPKHADYPSLLAEALDVLASRGWDAKVASVRLGCTPSQLVKLVREHAPAQELMNKEREARGLHRMK